MSFYTDFPKYPTAIFDDTDYPAQVNDVNVVYADLINALKEEMQACFAELGTLPKGYHASVKARIEALEVQLKVVLDYMEYATDGAAQLAYVSSDASETIKANYETGKDNVTAIGNIGGTEYWSTGKIVLAADIICSSVSVSLAANIGSPAGDLTFRLETDDTEKPSGTLAHANATYALASPTASAWNKIPFSSFVLPAGTYWLVISAPAQVNNTRYTWDVKSSGGNGGTGRRGYSGDAGANWSVDAFQVYLRLYSPAGLECYSDDIIPEQGTYCLKVIAVITASLNTTLTRTVSPVKDLSGKNSITLWARSDRTGENFKVEYHDSGGNTISYTVNILEVGTWEKKEIDVSEVADADKDAINEIKYTIINADAAAEMYLDNNFAT